MNYKRFHLHITEYLLWPVYLFNIPDFIKEKDYTYLARFLPHLLDAEFAEVDGYCQQAHLCFQGHWLTCSKESH